MNLGVQRLKDLGLNPVFLPHSQKGLDFIKDHPEARAEDLIHAFSDDSIDMILCTIGGDDTYRLLPYLFENDQLQKVIKQKIFLGFSDTTMNHLTLVSSIGYIFFQISNQLFLLYFNFKIGFFKSLFIRSAYTTWSTTSDIVVILCPASLEEAPQWYILCLSVFQSMIIYLSWNSPPDF